MPKSKDASAPQRAGRYNAEKKQEYAAAMRRYRSRKAEAKRSLQVASSEAAGVAARDECKRAYASLRAPLQDCVAAFVAEYVTDAAGERPRVDMAALPERVAGDLFVYVRGLYDAQMAIGDGPAGASSDPSPEPFPFRRCPQRACVAAAPAPRPPSPPPSFPTTSRAWSPTQAEANVAWARGEFAGRAPADTDDVLAQLGAMETPPSASA